MFLSIFLGKSARAFQLRPPLAIALFIIAIAASLWLPNLFTYGMFLDGVINASVANQYAQGVGSFFSLQQCNCPDGAYVGHPPLVFAMQASFFKLFGNAFYIDKMYSLLTAIGQLLLIGALWLKVAPEPKYKKLAWLPCLLWLLSPIISWGYSSNLLENTMSVFTTATLIVMLGFVRTGKNLWPQAIAAALLTFAAVLSKGPVALFVLAAPIVFIEAYAGYNLRKATVFMVVYMATFASLATAVWLLPEGNSFIKAYYQAQLQPALSATDTSAWDRLRLLPFLLKALTPMLAILVAAFVVTKTKLLNSIKVHLKSKPAYRFLILGLCATLPIMLSNKQSAFYVIPAIPVFAIGFALLIADVVSVLGERYGSIVISKGVGWLSLVAIVGMVYLCINNYGTALRDRDKLTDAAQINELLKDEKTIADPTNLFAEEYQLKAYLNRLYNISVNNDASPKFHIIKPETTLPENTKLVYKGKTVYVIPLLGKTL